MGLDGVGEGWTGIATEWAALWGGLAEPARRQILEAAHVGPGTRVLDVGCGSGELLALLTDAGAVAAGCDPASGMLELARTSAPGADLRAGEAEALPWPDGAFDVVTAVNALQLADDLDDTLAETARVLAPGGRLAVAGWADRTQNDLDAIEIAVAGAREEEPLPDGPLRAEGGLRSCLVDAGWAVVADGTVDVPWEAADDATLVRAVLLGEDGEERRRTGPVVLAAAAPFRLPGGSYRLRNRFRWAVALPPADRHRLSGRSAGGRVP